LPPNRGPHPQPNHLPPAYNLKTIPLRGLFAPRPFSISVLGHKQGGGEAGHAPSRSHVAPLTFGLGPLHFRP